MVASTTAVVHEVGDSQGWIIGNIDYSQWASTKNFHVNDILVFNYNNKYHNVMQVSKQEYESCTITNPIATFNTGKDSITLQAYGDYYYVCGNPGHCQIGQKFHINIVGTSSQGSASVVASPLCFMLLITIIAILEFCFFLTF
ncbi:mavicyanin-like [Solanum tuberosum]|uniref:Phytocyanin domain-containing protein n=1 Tax=Solanum tuberosum TaxID=4113 RepID=M1DXQ3_SOLTU|nr:PREDICTED: mavicyanin-like [Solanum tuberosum]